MYLRQTKRKNKDGTVAHYLQLAHNVRDPDTGVVSAKILHSFGRPSISSGSRWSG